MTTIDSHSAVTVGFGEQQRIYLFGGFINQEILTNRLFCIKPVQTKENFPHFVLTDINVADGQGDAKLTKAPLPRYGHGMIITNPQSADLSEQDIYIFGGLVTDIRKRCN